MKKEYIILVGLIIGLGAYLGLKKENRVHYDLPALSAVDQDKIDRIEITQKDQSLVLSKTDKTWTLGDEKFPADPSAVDKILDTVKELKLSALVSEAGDRIRYELDPANAIGVKAFEGQNEKRSFSIGKTAPSFNHTFVMLDNDKRIFQADKSFRDDFDKSIDDLRNKLVLEFTTKEIKKITLEKEGSTITLVQAKTEPGKGDEEKSVLTWQADNGSPADKTAASDLLSSLSHLECQEYLNKDSAVELKKDTPFCKIILENDTVLSLNLYKRDGQDTLGGISSSTPYSFTLDSYKTKDILSYVDKLLGLEKTEENTSDTE